MRKISIAWWNSSLSPTYKLRDKASADKSLAAAALTRVLTEAETDIIAFCEVSPGDVDRLIASGSLSGYAHHRAMGVAGRSAFDMCVFYRPQVVAVLSAVAVISSKGARITRIGQHLTFAVSTSSRPLHLFLSHWPSRLNAQQYEPSRHLFGIRLRDAIDRVRENDLEAQIILLGDYNDEPFDASIAEHLMATRDKDLVRRKRHLLYNPFWRHMASFSVADDSPSHYDSGSYYHRAGDLTRWRTFDQMMFSSPLIEGPEWVLDETSTRVLEVPGFLELVRSGGLGFDHLPLIGRLTKRAKNG